MERLQAISLDPATPAYETLLGNLLEFDEFLLLHIDGTTEAQFVVDQAVREQAFDHPAV